MSIICVLSDTRIIVSLSNDEAALNEKHQIEVILVAHRFIRQQRLLLDLKEPFFLYCGSAPNRLWVTPLAFVAAGNDTTIVGREEVATFLDPL